MSIKSPYNFVPLNQKVFFPEWKDSVSMDKPNGEALSGEIRYELEAKTPILVAGPQKKEDEKDNIRRFYCTARGYTIPATTIKGMVRSLVEIMSFGKLNRINDETYSVRDLNNEKLYTQHMRGVRCGWLTHSEDHWQIQDCGEPGRISHEEIDKTLATRFNHWFKNNPKDKTANFKYKQVPKEKTLSHKFEKSKKLQNGQLFVVSDKPYNQTGTIVFTGQASKRFFHEYKKKMMGKWLEFIFFETKNAPIHVLEKNVVKNFLFAYLDHDKNAISPDWRYWKEKDRIPVFFKLGDNGEVIHFGLSQLYKLPYNYSIGGRLSDEHKSDKPDFAESLFGYVRDKELLKGRVLFTPALPTNTPNEVSNHISVVLNSPKASYYPSYVEQPNPKKGYKTYMDDDHDIRGYKRYPVRTGANPLPATDKQGKVASILMPLQAGVRFRGNIRFHNLHAEELGVLICALTFDGDTANRFHSIGMGKPFGYGRCALAEFSLSMAPYITASADPNHYRARFVEIMSSFLGRPWLEHARITELLSMATLSPTHEALLSYMKIEPDNEFTKAKTDKERLEPYSKISEFKKPTSLVPLRGVAPTAPSASAKVEQSLTAEQKPQPKQQPMQPQKASTEPPSIDWKERLMKDLNNPARSIPGIIGDLKGQAKIYIGHEKEVIAMLEQLMRKKNQWQEQKPTEGKHDWYKLTQKVIALKAQYQ